MKKSEFKEIIKEAIQEALAEDFQFYLALNSDDGKRVFVAKKDDSNYYVADDNFLGIKVLNKPTAGRTLRVVGMAHDYENKKLNDLVKKYNP